MLVKTLALPILLCTVLYGVGAKWLTNKEISDLEFKKRITQIATVLLLVLIICIAVLMIELSFNLDIVGGIIFSFLLIIESALIMLGIRGYLYYQRKKKQVEIKAINFKKLLLISVVIILCLLFVSF